MWAYLWWLIGHLCSLNIQSTSNPRHSIVSFKSCLRSSFVCEGTPQTATWLVGRNSYQRLWPRSSWWLLLVNTGFRGGFSSWMSCASFRNLQLPGVKTKTGNFHGKFVIYKAKVLKVPGGVIFAFFPPCILLMLFSANPGSCPLFTGHSLIFSVLIWSFEVKLR